MATYSIRQIFFTIANNSLHIINYFIRIPRDMEFAITNNLAGTKRANPTTLQIKTVGASQEPSSHEVEEPASKRAKYNEDSIPSKNELSTSI